MKAVSLIILLCFALLAGGCGGGNDSSGGSTESSGSTESTGSTESSAPEEKATKPKVTVPEGPAPTKLVKKDLRPGTGPAAKAGDEVSVQYVLVDYKSGKEIEASWDSGKPFEFQLGSEQVIPGWEQGVVGMKEGGRRELIVPSQLAYGKGALVFVIDLLSIGPTSEQGKEEGEHPVPEIKVPDEPPPKELVVKDLEKGSGPAVGEGDEIVVEYVAVNYKTGKPAETVWGKPTTFTVGSGELIKGWERGIRGMKVGGRRELIIPSKLAFGKGTLIYVVDLLEIK
jgi:peptidylprolyl isomerase